MKLLATVRISSLQARLSRQPGAAHLQKRQEISMKRLFRCLMAMSFLAISSAALSQSGYARQEQQGQQQDQMKKDETKKDEMKKDKKKDKKAKKEGSEPNN